MRGVPLTPEQLATAAAVFARTGNYSEAARAIGASDPSTVRQALRRHADTNRHQLHARACARAGRAGRRALTANVARLDALLRKWVDEPLAAGADSLVEPRDVAAVSNALGAAVAHLSEVGRALEQRRQARLTRDKTRAETDLTRARARALLDMDAILAAATEEEFAVITAVVERIEARRRASDGVAGAGES